MPRTTRHPHVDRLAAIVLAIFTLAACGGDTANERPSVVPADSAASANGPLVVFNAGSLARPLRAALDTFAAREGIRVEQEQAGSLETARKITELGRAPDIIALADQEVFPQLLMPEHVGWYVRFARNRMVLAYGAKAKFADEITADNWFDVVRRPGVEVGHSDPNVDPAGYRALMVFQLAERHYQKPGLAQELSAAIPARNLRPKSADLVALAETGELDYVWEYESVARGAGLRFVQLPAAIDLGDPAGARVYGLARVRVLGRSPTDTIAIAGQPITYALSSPKNAPHPALAEKFVAWLIGEEGRRILRAHHLDALEVPVFVGAATPPPAPAAPAGSPPAQR